jgi:hypothetical protein
MKQRWWLALSAYAVAVALMFGAKALAPDAGLFRDLLTDGVLLRIGGATKLLLLTLSWRFAARTAGLLEEDNPARGPWRLFALGLLAFAAGQAVLSTYQVVLGTSPYPSLGDLFFMAAYPALIAAAFGFIRAYREAGYPVGSHRQHAAIGLGLAVVFAAIGYALLSPILAQDASLVERLVTAAYPALDFVLLVPILILVRIAAGFRGGRIFEAWAALLTGVVCLCAADILYAYFAVMELPRLEPLVDTTYVLAYFFLAYGTRGQLELVGG